MSLTDLTKYNIRFQWCQWCGKRKGVPHHIVFRSQGGTDEESNLITLCIRCHNRAHFKTVPYLTKRMLYLCKEVFKALDLDEDFGLEG